MKTRKRWISLLVALTFLLSLIPMGAALGADPVTFTNAKAAIEKEDNQSLGWIKVSVDSDTLGVTGWVYATVELPSGVKYAVTTGSVGDYTGSGASADEIKSIGSQSLTVSKALYSGGDTNVIFIFVKDTNSRVNISSSASDQIVVKVTAKIIDSFGYQVGSTYTYDALVGEKVAKEVTVSADTAKALAVAKENQTGAKITFTESAAGSFAVGDEVYLELPSSYFAWNNNTSLTPGAYGLNATKSIDGEKLTIKITAPSALADTLKLTPVIDVMPGAPDGDVTVNITSSSTKVKEATLVIGTVGAPTVTVTAGDPKEVFFAKNNQAVADVTVKATGQVQEGKSIVIAAPSGVKFAADPSCTNSASVLRYDDNKRVWIKVYAADEFKITNIKLNVSETVPVGELKLSFSGDAGATGDVVVAKVLAPATISATPVQVIAGRSAQAAADITITETKPSSLSSYDGISTDPALKISLPSAVKFADEFKYKVNEGTEYTTSGAKGKSEVVIEDLTLGGAKDTIKLYGIKYDVDSGARGDIEVALSGKSLSADYADKTILKVVNAKAVSPTAAEAVLTIGSTTMTVNGKEVTMDVAPYLKDGRTFLPVRFAANAVGVSDANIIWDGANQRVTILKGDRIVQMTIGEKTLLLNGASIPMDVAPEVVPPGRTMLPIRFLAMALGADIAWNPDTQTVTIKVE